VPKLKEGKCDNVLLDEGYHTPEEEVTDEFGSVELWVGEESDKTPTEECSSITNLT
jgi:hypothetical protein